jgi:hypothetical protein
MEEESVQPMGLGSCVLRIEEESSFSRWEQCRPIADRGRIILQPLDAGSSVLRMEEESSVRPMGGGSSVLQVEDEPPVDQRIG